MFAFRSWRWSALALTCGFAAPAARADLITPDSLPNPPTTVSSAAGTVVSTSNIVSTQYVGLGLFFQRAAITQLNNTPVWVPVTNSNPGTINYSGMGVEIVVPGHRTDRPVSSVTVDLIGLKGAPSIWAANPYGEQFNIATVLQSDPGPDGGQLWTLTGNGIIAFGFSPPSGQSGPWGISEISITPMPLPEPASLVLAGLAVLGMATHGGWRRVRWAWFS